MSTRKENEDTTEHNADFSDSDHFYEEDDEVDNQRWVTWFIGRFFSANPTTIIVHANETEIREKMSKKWTQNQKKFPPSFDTEWAERRGGNFHDLPSLCCCPRWQKFHIPHATLHTEVAKKLFLGSVIPPLVSSCNPGQLFCLFCT